MKTIREWAASIVVAIVLGTIILIAAMALLVVFAMTATYLDEHWTNGAILRAVVWFNTVGTGS